MSANDSSNGSEKTWDDWSDFEVNAHVTAIAAGFGLSFLVTGDGTSVHKGEFGDGLCGATIKDYCNSWSDMGPIIADREISLHWDWDVMGECSAIGDTYVERSLGLRQVRHECTSKNPLRAAAIVFLMMNGVKP